MTDKPIIQADFVKPNLVPSRKVLQLVFEVPEEAADHAMAVLGGIPQSGKNRWCAIARLATPAVPADARSAPEAPQTPEEPKRATEGWSEAKRKMVQRSGILRNSPTFQAYVQTGWGVLWNHERHKDADASERAAYFIRTNCGVDSCRDLDPDKLSGQRFREMDERYISSLAGQTPDEQERQMRREG